MAAFVDIRAGERRPTFVAFAIVFGITAAHTLLETARDALFLARLPASRLPWVYLAIAALGLALARLNARRPAKGLPRFAVPLSLLVASLVTTAFWVLLSSRAPWLLYALYTWTGIFASWVVVQFWLLVGSLYTVQQAKRLYGLIGGGSVLGAVAGAGAARLLTGALEARHLLLAAAGLLVLTAIGPGLWLKPGTSHESRSARRREETAEANVAEDPYVRRILALVLLATLTLTVVDYLFKEAVASRVAPAKLGQFFADVYVVLNGIALVVQFGLVGFLLRTFGVHRALWVMPILLGFGSISVILGGGLAAALLLKGVDGTLRHSLHRTSVELLFVPIPDAVRTRAKPLIDLVAQRGGQALASLAILLMVSSGVSEAGFAALVAALSLGWIAIARGVRKPYLEVFRSTLRDGRVDYQGDLPELDLAALETIFAGLNSRKDPEVVGALDLLAAQSRAQLIPALILYHPSKAIVLRALELFAEQRRVDFVPVAERLIEAEDLEVAAAALSARMAVDADETMLRGYLENGRDELRATAFVGLLSHGHIGDEEASIHLAAFAGHERPTVRVTFARAIAKDPSPRFAKALLAMTASSDVGVRVEVALAMGQLGDERLIGPLAALLPDREVGVAAREALVTLGAAALRYLDGALGDTSLPRELRWALPRAIAEFEPTEAAGVLSRHLLLAPEGITRYRILRALSKLRADDPSVSIDRAVLEAAIERTLESAFFMLSHRLTLARGAEEKPERLTPALSLLLTLLRDKETLAKGRLFRLLGLLYPTEMFSRIQRGLESKNPKARASSRELIENVVRGRFEKAIVTLVDDVSDEARLEAAPAALCPAGANYEELVATLAGRRGELGSLALTHASELRLQVEAPSGGVSFETPLSAELAAEARTRTLTVEPA